MHPQASNAWGWHRTADTADAGTGGTGGSRPANSGARHQGGRPIAPHRSLVALVLLLGITTVALALAMVTCQADAGPAPANLLIVIGLAVLFGSILAASWLPTEADEAIAQAVENERSYGGPPGRQGGCRPAGVHRGRDRA